MSDRLPPPLPYVYPELQHFGDRKEQLQMLARTNTPAVHCFLATCLVTPILVGDWFEALAKRWLPISGPTADVIAASGVVILLVSSSLGVMWFTRHRARRMMWEALAKDGRAICTGCGYDLRAGSDERCPECGATPAA